jgi:hypothetical protein
LSICYLVVGSSLATVKPSIARIFQLLGYGFFALILLGLLARQVSFLRKSHELIPSSRTVSLLNHDDDKRNGILNPLIPGRYRSAGCSTIPAGP